MKKLLLGTTDKGKIEEYRKLLSDLPMEFVSLNDLGIAEKPEVTGKTFEENAVLKAKFYYEKSGIPTLVDDGGLEIEALNGEPGVHSQRWLGHEMSDEELIGEVMKRMEGQTNRGCRLNLVVALATPFGIMTSDAAVEGVIAETIADKKIEGNPYRSLMYFPNYDKYYCDLTDQEHEILNHRKHALDKIKDMFVEISKS
ncbi:MAG: non-canonical purine NTP pyrophosphatase [Candidatus Doudnabacteria bacterium]|nr:non-canonical purine NTP pyrophosphatase [Candidatus Doudnabacteria bacterium]